MNKVKIKKGLVCDEIYNKVKDNIIFEDDEYYFFTQEYFENNYYYYFVWFFLGYDIDSIKFDENNKLIVKDLKFSLSKGSFNQLNHIKNSMTSSELDKVDKILTSMKKRLKHEDFKE